MHRGKYERLTQLSQLPEGFKESARFLGAWLEGSGKNEEDSRQRIRKATRLWQKLFSQVQRLNLDRKHCGMLAKATVLACLLFGAACRTFTAKQIRDYQTLMNRVAMGLCAQRRRTMHDDQVTLQDLRKTLHLDTVSVSIGWKHRYGGSGTLSPLRLAGGRDEHHTGAKGNRIWAL